MTLRLNLRNTQSISKLTSNLYSGPVMYTYGPIGTKPEIQIENDLDRAVERVLRLILQLIRQEGVKMSSIAVLSKNSGILDRLKPGLLANRILFSPADKYAIESITLDTVSRFKGMESPFVILFADRELSDHEELSYVATSRARSHLYIIGNIEGTLLRAALDKIS
jgi:superfamily I DNA/RNA helicase